MAKKERPRSKREPKGPRKGPASKKAPAPERVGPGFAKRLLPYLDAIFFVLLMLTASVIVVFVLPQFYGSGSEEKDIGMADLCSQTSQALLMSTVPYCSYRDTQGQEAQYLDQPVSYLLCQDLYIRSNYKATLDGLSLRQGVELAVSRLATSLLMDGYGFLLNVSGGRGVSFLLFNFYGREASPASIDPSNPEVMSIHRDAKGNALHSTSTFILPDGNEARISFYLFKTKSFDTDAVLGGGV